MDAGGIGRKDRRRIGVVAVAEEFERTDVRERHVTDAGVRRAWIIVVPRRAEVIEFGSDVSVRSVNSG